MPRNKNKKNRKGKQSKKAARRNGRSSGNRVYRDLSVSAGRAVTIYKSPGEIIPEQLCVTLHFYQTNNISNVAAGYCSKAFRTNSVYDADPAVGTTAITGFTELAGLYSHYRVLQAAVAIDVSNNEAFAQDVFIYPWSNPGTAPSNTNDGNTPDMIMNYRSKHAILSAKGGMDRATLRDTYNLADLYSKDVLTEDAYASTISTNPASITYMLVGGYGSGSNVYTAAGLALFTHIRYTVMFYGRAVLNT